MLSIFNGYDSADSPWQWNVLYNVSGRRIVEVGTSGLPDVYEQPRNLIDLVVGLRIGTDLTLKFKGKNLLNEPIIQRAGDQIQAKGYPGTSFSVGLKYAP